MTPSDGAHETLGVETPPSEQDARLTRLPAVEHLLQRAREAGLVERHGRDHVVKACRAELGLARRRLLENADDGAQEPPSPSGLVDAVRERLDARLRSTLRPVFNLTGIVLHTNLGRASLPDCAVAAVAAVARGPSTLEYDLDRGERGERDLHTEGLLCELTGAEAATIVNNNAAAVLLVLNTLALRGEVLVSRGELVEIGGAFRVPEIMARAGAKLREVGTTNRTHARDYRETVTKRTALIMRVHPSNYRIEGFTAAVPDIELARIAQEANLPFVSDLGSGSLLDLSRFGLPREPTAREAIAAGANLVTFSGDKLLGGPQAGIIVGRRTLVERIRRNPLKRALRCDKMTIAALEAVLRLYDDQERAQRELPTLRLIARPAADIAALAERLAPRVAAAFEGLAQVEVSPCRSQVGSGALPAALLASTGLRIGGRRRKGALSARRILEGLRRLPVPVIGRAASGAVMLDLRCLEDEALFIANLQSLPAALRELADALP